MDPRSIDRLIFIEDDVIIDEQRGREGEAPSEQGLFVLACHVMRTLMDPGRLID